MSTPAFAQESEDASVGNEVIVVTAQFREQRLQDTPLAITAVNAAALEAKNQTDLSEVADRAPNVSLRPQGGAFGPSISASIRGVGQNDFSPAYEPGVGIYIDDVYYPQLTGAVFDLLDLDRVEILRGPQGTLAGRNSIGGAIKMYSRKPEGSNSGFIEATYGSRNKISLRASGDFALTDDLSGRISGVFKSQDGYVDVLDFGCVNQPGTALNPTDDGMGTALIPIEPTRSVGECKISEMGDEGYQAVRGVLRYNSSDMDLDIMISADYTNEERGNAAEVLDEVQTFSNVNINPTPDIPLDDRFICGKFCNYANFYHPAAIGDYLFAPDAELAEFRGQNKTTYEGYNFSNQIHVGLSDRISVDNILGYGRFSAAFDSDGDLSPAFTGNGHNDLTHWHWSEELRLNFNPIDPVNLVVGGYYFKQSTTYFSYQDLRYVPVFPLQFQQPDVVTADSKAVFANLGWEIMPDLNLNAGARYTKESKEYNYFRLNMDGTINPFLDPVGAADGAGAPGALTGNAAVYSGNNTDFRVALDYRMSDALMVYASVATGFKGGGTNPRPFNAAQAIGFGPEELTNYELGFKSDLLDNRLRLNTSVFLAKYKDVQIGVSVCPVPPPNDVPCAARVNAGDGEFKGVEVEFQAEPVDGFTIDGSASYLDFKYTRLNPEAEYPTSAGGAVKTDPPGGTPKQKWNIGAQYEAFLGDGGTLTPRVDVEHTGKIFIATDRFSTPGERLLQFLPSVTTMNARLTWRNADEDLDISLVARNLTDKYHFLTRFDLRNAGQGTSKALVAPPREISLVVKKQF